MRCARWRVGAHRWAKSYQSSRRYRAIHHRTRRCCRRRDPVFRKVFSYETLNVPTASLAPLLAEFAHQLHRFINHFRPDIERRTETDRVFTGTKCQDAEIEEPVPKLLARFCVGQIEGEKQTTAARGGNQRLF